MLDSRVDRDEGRRQSGHHEHGQDELGQDERSVVGIEVAASAEGAGEGPVTHQAHDVADEGQGREQDRPARDQRVQARLQCGEASMACDIPVHAVEGTAARFRPQGGVSGS